MLPLVSIIIATYNRSEILINRTIPSVLNQTYKNYKIHFNIPHINKKNNREYIIPTWLDDISKKSVLKIFRTEDYGSITKIYPTIKRINDPEQIIITVDDDLVYESRLIEEHVRLREINDDKTAIGFAGLNNIGEKLFLSNSSACRAVVMPHTLISIILIV